MFRNLSALDVVAFVIGFVIVLLIVAFAQSEPPIPVLRTTASVPPLKKAGIPPLKKVGCDCAVTGVCTCGADCSCPLCFDYGACRARAIATRQPLVVCVGGYLCPPCLAEIKRAYPGAVVCYQTDSWAGFIDRGIVVGVPTNGELVAHQFVPGATGAEMVQAIQGKAVQPVRVQYQPAYQFAPVSYGFSAGACRT